MKLSDKNIKDKIKASTEYQKKNWPGFQRVVSRVALDEEPEILACFGSIQPGERVLEVGCGIGRIVGGFMGITPNVVGLDVLWEAAKIPDCEAFRLFKGAVLVCLLKITPLIA